MASPKRTNGQINQTNEQVASPGEPDTLVEYLPWSKGRASAILNTSCLIVKNGILMMYATWKFFFELKINVSFWIGTSYQQQTIASSLTDRQTEEKI